MRKLLLTCLVFVSCQAPDTQDVLDQVNTGGSGGNEDNIIDETPLEPPPNFVSPQMSVNYSLNKFDENETQKMEAAIAEVIKVFNSYEFKQKILEHLFNGEMQFHDNEGYTNSQIYDIILAADEEVLNDGPDGEVDLQLTLYYSSSSTVGYTYPSTLETWVNEKYFDKYDLSEVARNVAHEWMHKLGFTHDKYHNSSRPFSVPYAIGYMVEDMVAKNLGL
jgi:hypothetical protein